jgi:hypothetical protein
MKNSRSASKRELNYAEDVSYRLVHFAVWLASAALCFGTSIERNPIKKKGAGPLFQIHYGDKWGFMDRTGRIVIQPQFSDVGDFFDWLAPYASSAVSRVGRSPGDTLTSAADALLTGKRFKDSSTMRTRNGLTLCSFGRLTVSAGKATDTLAHLPYSRVRSQLLNSFTSDSLSPITPTSFPFGSKSQY